jgi:hypothetical protein
MLTATLHERKCKQCDRTFMQQRPLQYVCGPLCAGKRAKAERAAKKIKEKAEKRADKAKRLAMLSLPKLHRMTQLVFNRWVRLRDAKEPCISCGAPPPNMEKLHAGRDAGHYRSVGTAPHLRYDEANVHAQCVHCNQFLAGNVLAYRAGLTAKIGFVELERLENDNRVHKWTRDELNAKRDHYRNQYGRLIREIKKGTA